MNRERKLHDPCNAQSALVPSGLLGPVQILTQLPEAVK
jgi:hypothetical protein